MDKNIYLCYNETQDGWWNKYEEKLKNINDPQEIRELKEAIGQCKLALNQYSIQPKTRKSISPVIDQPSTKSR